MPPSSNPYDHCLSTLIDKEVCMSPKTLIADNNPFSKFQKSNTALASFWKQYVSCHVTVLPHQVLAVTVSEPIPGSRANQHPTTPFKGSTSQILAIPKKDFVSLTWTLAGTGYDPRINSRHSGA